MAEGSERERRWWRVEEKKLTGAEREMLEKMAGYMDKMTDKQRRELLIFAEGAAMMAQAMARASA